MWSPDAAAQLRARGHDVLAVAERAELRGRTDAEIFEFALTEKRVVVTENVVDYRPLAAQALGRGVMHPGIILTTNRRFPRNDPGTIGRLITALDELLMAEYPLANMEYWLS